MNKIAIVIMADPALSDESLGRVLNALVLANDLEERGETVSVYFQGAGTRWVNMLEKKDHPGHQLYKNLTKTNICASYTCAQVFKAEITTIPLLKEYDVPNLGAVSSLASAMVAGYQLVTF